MGRDGPVACHPTPIMPATRTISRLSRHDCRDRVGVELKLNVAGGDLDLRVADVPERPGASLNQSRKHSSRGRSRRRRTTLMRFSIWRSIRWNTKAYKGA